MLQEREGRTEIQIDQINTLESLEHFLIENAGHEWPQVTAVMSSRHAYFEGYDDLQPAQKIEIAQRFLSILERQKRPTDPQFHLLTSLQQQASKEREYIATCLGIEAPEAATSESSD